MKDIADFNRLMEMLMKEMHWKYQDVVFLPKLSLYENKSSISLDAFLFSLYFLGTIEIRGSLVLMGKVIVAFTGLVWCDMIFQYKFVFAVVLLFQTDLRRSFFAFSDPIFAWFDFIIVKYAISICA